MASNLSQRIISGIIAGTVALAALLFHPYSFALLMLVVVAISAREWAKLGIAIWAKSPHKRWSFNAAFLLYMAPCAIALWWLRTIEPHGAQLALTCLVCVWIIDIAAYAFGRTIGGPQIAPSVSPSKTWAGLLGAVLCLVITGLFIYDYNPFMAALLGLMAVIAQAGDFFESWLKRKAGVKDSGTILPGHGGMLDRIDGLVFAAPYFAYLQTLGSL